MNNKIAAVIGIGPNSLEIPLLVFQDNESAHSYLKNLGLNLDESETYSVYDELNTENNKVMDGLFKGGDYYGGCGECDVLEVREIEFGKPMVGWDLD